MTSLALAILLFPTPHPEFSATITRVRDGDTIEVLAHLPFDVHIDVPIRVYGVNCPETRGLNAKAGKKAQAFTETWALNYPEVLIQDTGVRSFDRWVSPVCLPAGGTCLADALVESGLCKRDER